MTEDGPRFVGADEDLERLMADPALVSEVEQIRGETREMDRAHAMSLAMIRKAGDLTQVEMSRRLGIGQGVVSRMERRDDMLLSTLRDYLIAAGAEGVRIVVDFGGREVDLDLGTLPAPRRPGDA